MFVASQQYHCIQLFLHLFPTQFLTAKTVITLSKTWLHLPPPLHTVSDRKDLIHPLSLLLLIFPPTHSPLAAKTVSTLFHYYDYFLGLARTMYIRCIYGTSGREVTKIRSHTVHIYGSGQPY